jgi:hypothetical protein
MNRKMVYGVFILLLLSMPFIFSNFNTNFQTTQKISSNSSELVKVSDVSITSPDDLTLPYENATNQTISWTLTENSSQKYLDYLGLYSFTDDAVGTTPAGWTPTIPNGNNIKVVAGMAGHNKVAFINATIDEYSSGTPVILENAFTPHTSGTISFWMYPNSTGSQGNIIYVLGTGGYVFMLDFHPAGYWAWCYMGTYSSIGAGAKLRNWYHIVMQFDDTAQTVQLYINGTHFTKSYCYPGLTNTPASILFREFGPNQYLYVDAVDYSWAPGYYPNRNTNYMNFTYAIFDDGTQKTTWKAWSDQVTVAYNVSGPSLGAGLHNISLVFNDLSGIWSHDDVQVTVGNPEAPKILDVVQEPVTPAFLEAVTVTAHITDNSAVQTVLIESNSSGEGRSYKGAYSFTNDVVGTTPAGWTSSFPSGNNVQIVAEMAGHNKVAFINATTDEYNQPNGTPIVLENAFTPKTSGTISFWVYLNSTGSQGDLIYVVGTGGYVFMLDFHPLGSWWWCYMGTWSPIGAGAKLRNWYHIVMQFDDAARTVQLYINGTHFTKSYCYPGLTWTPSSLRFLEYGPNQFMYVDAVDYSWAPGYYPNRNTEYSGLTNYSMSFTSGNPQDGEWNYTFNNYPTNKSISYRIFAQDIFGSWNISEYYNFGYFDTLGPNILSVTQAPSEPTYLDTVDVTVHVTDATQVQTVSIQTNHTGTFSSYLMSLISGTSQNGIWKFSFSTYPLNAMITYSISTEDIFGNSNSSAQGSFGVFDLLDPAILSVVQTPVMLTKWEAVKVTVHVQENLALGSVMFNSNYTGSWADYPMTLLNGSLQDGFWEYTVTSYPYNKSIWYQISAIDVSERTTTSGYSQFGFFPIVSTYVPLELEYEVDVGMAGDRKTDITFTFQNTGNTHLVNINFTIQLPTGWTVKKSVQSVSQLAPGQNVTITFKITVPKDIGEFLELVVIKVDARIAELGIDWPTQSIEVVVSGVKVWDLFIWLVVIVGSASAAVTTTYVYVHRRSVGQQASKMKIKGKSNVAISEALSSDIPGPLSVISMEVMAKIENLRDITPDEKSLLIQYISQLEEEDALIYLDQIKNTETN